MISSYNNLIFGRSRNPVTTTTTSTTTGPTTTTTTTICQRPVGLTNGNLIVGCHNAGDLFRYFSDVSVQYACETFNYFRPVFARSGTNIAYRDMQYSTLAIGEIIYDNYNGTDCTKVSNGFYWFQPDITDPVTYFKTVNQISIVTTVNGVITAIDVCDYVPTTTTSSTSTTTSTTTAAPTTTTTSTTTAAPTTTTTSTTTAAPTTTTTSTTTAAPTTTTTSTTTAAPTTTTTSTTTTSTTTTTTSTTTAAPTTSTTTLDCSLAGTAEYVVAAITTVTEINIWFDNSGSMDSTLLPLEYMRDNLLKNCIGPIYGYNPSVPGSDALYNERVKVNNFSTGNAVERFVVLLATPRNFGRTADATVNQVLNLTFADESDSYGNGNGNNPITFNNAVIAPGYSDDIATLRANVAANPGIKGVAFQVNTGPGSYPSFRALTQATFVNTGIYTPNANISDLPQFTYELDVTAGVNINITPADQQAPYYLTKITEGLTTLGFTVNC